MLAWDVDVTGCWLLVTTIFFVSLALMLVLLPLLSPMTVVVAVDVDGDD